MILTCLLLDWLVWRKFLRAINDSYLCPKTLTWKASSKPTSCCICRPQVLQFPNHTLRRGWLQSPLHWGAGSPEPCTCCLLHLKVPPLPSSAATSSSSTTFLGKHPWTIPENDWTSSPLLSSGPCPWGPSATASFTLCCKLSSSILTPALDCEPSEAWRRLSCSSFHPLWLAQYLLQRRTQGIFAA